MAYPMTHLLIAKNLAEKQVFHITNMPQYYLGAMAPDAVWFSEVNDKKKSHLITSDETWGAVDDNEGWLKNVQEFFAKNYNKGDNDFLCGYCTHILTDMNSNIKSWTPFRLRYKDKTIEEIIKISHEQGNHKTGNIIDQALFHKNSLGDQFFENLQNSKTMNFMDMQNLTTLVTAEEMEKMKNNILNVQYNTSYVDSGNYDIVSYNKNLDFINDSSEFIAEEVGRWKR